MAESIYADVLNASSRDARVHGRTHMCMHSVGLFVQDDRVLANGDRSSMTLSRGKHKRHERSVVTDLCIETLQPGAGRLELFLTDVVDRVVFLMLLFPICLSCTPFLPTDLSAFCFLHGIAGISHHVYMRLSRSKVDRA